MASEKTPFSPRATQQTLPADGTSAGNNDRTHHIFTEDEILRQKEINDNEGAPYELIQVNLTVYGLTGILCQKREKSQRNQRSKGRKKQKENDNIMETVDGIVNGFKAPPLVAIVSCRKNVTKNGTRLETFLPSDPMEKVEFNNDPTGTFTASWPADQSNYLTGIDNFDTSTFKMVRAMKHQTYRKNTKLGFISNYVHETVEFVVYVGRGMQLVPVGTATFVITGNEEQEVLLNIPIKPILNAKKRNEKKKKGGKKKRCFPDNEGVQFTVDENAVLRLGVRALPETCIKEATCSTENRQIQTRKDFEELLDGLGDENIVSEWKDEKRLLDKIAEAEKALVRNEKRQEFEQSCTPRSHSQIFRSFLCGALENMCDTENSRGEQINLPKHVETVDTTASLNTTDKPVTLMSSVSFFDEFSDDSMSTSEERTIL